ncbi:MAG: ribosome maturation factor RimP [Alphaproteobacteria bacterium]|nr:ribosome maturation factor RimP [Alphaproteobacteria bacterium]
MKKAPAPDRAFTRLLDPVLAKRGYGLIRIRLTGGGSYPTLQVMAERLDGKPMTVQDCVAISHAVSRQLEASGASASSYTLEVSAPGEDRPLIRIEDFERFAGRTAVVEMRAPVGGRQRFQGRIVRVKTRKKEAELELHTASGPVRVPVKGIAEARLSGAPVPSADNREADT